jgi:hypothetical protein
MPAEITKVEADIDAYVFAKLKKVAQEKNLSLDNLVALILNKGVINL